MSGPYDVTGDSFFVIRLYVSLQSLLTQERNFEKKNNDDEVHFLLLISVFPNSKKR